MGRGDCERRSTRADHRTACGRDSESAASAAEATARSAPTTHPTHPTASPASASPPGLTTDADGLRYPRTGPFIQLELLSAAQSIFSVLTFSACVSDRTGSGLSFAATQRTSGRNLRRSYRTDPPDVARSRRRSPRGGRRTSVESPRRGSRGTSYQDRHGYARSVETRSPAVVARSKRSASMCSLSVSGLSTRNRRG